MSTFIQQGCIKLIKSDRLCDKILLFQINPNFPFIKQSWNKVSPKIFSSTTVFNIDNNKKCFLSSRSVNLSFVLEQLLVVAGVLRNCSRFAHRLVQRLVHKQPEKLYQRKLRKERWGTNCFFFFSCTKHLLCHMFMECIQYGTSLCSCTSQNSRSLGFINVSSTTAEGLFTNIGSHFSRLFGTDTWNYRREM